jgi:curved DNA-binding protein CbpA
MKNYYEILEVPRDASAQRIKEQYLLLINAWHPDKFTNPAQKAIAEEKTKDINEAYSILKNPVKRYEYDPSYQRNKKENNDHLNQKENPVRAQQQAPPTDLEKEKTWKKEVQRIKISEIDRKINGLYKEINDIKKQSPKSPYNFVILVTVIASCFLVPISLTEGSYVIGIAAIICVGAAGIFISKSNRLIKEFRSKIELNISNKEHEIDLLLRERENVTR